MSKPERCLESCQKMDVVILKSRNWFYLRILKSCNLPFGYVIQKQSSTADCFSKVALEENALYKP